MKLIGSLTSPFTRIVRVVLEELSVPHEFSVTAPFGKLSPEQEHMINSHNPIMKVPILLDDNEMIIDSRVIITHLLRKHGKSASFSAKVPLSIKEENQWSIVYGIIEAGVLRFVMSKDGYDAEKGYLKRSLDRIHSGLAYLNQELQVDDAFGMPQAALICCLEWYTKRKIVDWSKYEQLARIHEKHANRDSLVKTRIPAEL